MEAVERRIDRKIAEEVAKIPTPKDGKDGQDGLGFDNLEVTIDGRDLKHTYALGERKREFVNRLPIPMNKDIWREGQLYEKHDEVTWGGSVWIAREDTTDKPGDGATAWSLRTKRGRDGRDGKDGKAGERGPPGRDGRVA
jgi:integrin beta 3